MNILYDVKAYLEAVAVLDECEWGGIKSLDEIISDGDMPEIYTGVLAAIKELEGMK